MTSTSVPSSNRSDHGATRRALHAPGARATWQRPLLTLDAVACVVIGAVLLAAPTGLVAAVGTATAGPFRLVGAAFLLAAAVNGWAARAPGRISTYLAVDLDLLCVVGFTVLLVADPVGSDGLARALYGAGVAVPLVLGVAKVVGLRRPDVAGRGR